MLEKVKLALRIKSATFNDEINDLIKAALADLRVAGVSASEDDALINRAVIAYCKANFGEAVNAERWKIAYDELKAQMQISTGYTDWGETDG